MQLVKCYFGCLQGKKYNFLRYIKITFSYNEVRIKVFTNNVSLLTSSTIHVTHKDSEGYVTNFSTKLFKCQVSTVAGALFNTFSLLNENDLNLIRSSTLSHSSVKVKLQRKYSEMVSINSVLNINKWITKKDNSHLIIMLHTTALNNRIS